LNSNLENEGAGPADPISRSPAEHLSREQRESGRAASSNNDRTGRSANIVKGGENEKWKMPEV
jgi:hypothetical protein